MGVLIDVASVLLITVLTLQMEIIILTRITRGARPALAAFFRAHQYPCSRFPVYDPAAHGLVVPATMMMLQLIVPKFRPHPSKES